MVDDRGESRRVKSQERGLGRRAFSPRIRFLRAGLDRAFHQYIIYAGRRSRLPCFDESGSIEFLHGKLVNNYALEKISPNTSMFVNSLSVFAGIILNFFPKDLLL